jgi:hypothetical protein
MEEDYNNRIKYLMWSGFLSGTLYPYKDKGNGLYYAHYEGNGRYQNYP